MAHLSIIGTGNMGQAIASVAGRGGHTVQLLGKNGLDTAIETLAHRGANDRFVSL